METLSHAIGQDPVMDRAIARAAHSLSEFSRTSGTDQVRAEALAASSRRLWGATARLHGGVETLRFRALRRAIRMLVVDCREAGQALQRDQAVNIDPLYADFAAVVRRYRSFVIAEQADRCGDLIGGMP